jgi:hypothetical protein
VINTRQNLSLPTCPTKDTFAAAWPVIVRTEHPAVAPAGGGSALFVYPKDGLSTMILTNLSGATPDSFIDALAGFFIAGMKK